MDRNRIIGYWLMLGVGMLIVQIFLGGVTRLTGSGLSITEWKAVMGALPPMNAHDWQEAFDKYKQFDQYRLVNSSMTLPEFKYIFFWEYIHRLWARFMALCAFLPMLYFAYKRILRRNDILRILLLIALGGLAGFVGWIMVASGLEKEKVLVNPVKLMLHLLIASLIIGMTFRFALEYLYPKQAAVRSDSRNGLSALLVLVVIQIGFGALVAGSKAALNATDWPLMAGAYFPPHLGFLQPWSDHIHENNLLLQFLHRHMAYILVLFVIVLFGRLKPKSAEYQFTHRLLLFAVLFQAAVGITTLLFTKGKVPVFWGELHQLGAYLLLLSVIAAHYFDKYRNA